MSLLPWLGQPVENPSGALHGPWMHICGQARSDEQSAGVTKRGAPNALDSMVLLWCVSGRRSMPALARCRPRSTSCNFPSDTSCNFPSDTTGWPIHLRLGGARAEQSFVWYETDPLQRSTHDIPNVIACTRKQGRVLVLNTCV